MISMEKIECPYCHYDGSDLKIGRKMPYVELGVIKLRCSKCKQVFVLKNNDKYNQVSNWLCEYCGKVTYESPCVHCGK